MNMIDPIRSWCAVVAVGLLAGCGARSTDEIGGKTSWLSRCDRDADCASLNGGRCVQNLCTARCEPSSCDKVSGTACATSNVAACITEPTCLPTCSRQGDCAAFGSGYDCIGSVCVVGCGETQGSVSVDVSDETNAEETSLDGGTTPALSGPATAETPSASNPTSPTSEAPNATQSAEVASEVPELTTSAEPPEQTSETTSSSSAAPTESGPLDTTADEPPLPPLIVEGNLLVNGDFEETIEPWTVMGNAAILRSEAEAHTGNASLVCGGRTQQWEGPALELLSVMEPGKQYVMKAWVWVNEVSPFHIVAAAPCLGDAGVSSDDSLVYIPVGSALGYELRWTQIETAPFAMRDDCALESFTLYVEGPNPAVGFYLDDVSLVAVD